MWKECIVYITSAQTRDCFLYFSPIRTPFLWAHVETGLSIVFIEATNKKQILEVMWINKQCADQKQPRKGGDIVFLIISQWRLSVALETRLPQNFMQPFPHPSDVSHKIWSRLANWLQRYSNLKVDHDGRTTDHCYTISSLCEPFGSGEIKINSSEAICGMKLKLCRNVHGGNFYKNIVFYCCCMGTLVAMAT